MKTVTKILLISLLVTGSIQARKDKPYEVKSIIIEYEIKGKDTIGKKRVLLDDYGNRELVETNIVKKESGKVDKTHIMHYLHRDVSYGVDFEHKIIHRMSNYMGMTFGVNKFKDTVDESLKAMHLNKVGTNTVAGVKCDVWRLGKSIETCYYKGLPLRTNISGVQERATKIVIDAKLSLKDFKLPDYPINGRKFTQDELEAIDNKVIAKQNRRQKEANKGMAILKEAYKKAGVAKGKRPTKEQMKIIKAYMQKAMFPIQKEKILKRGEGLERIKACYQKAQTAEEANRCTPKNNKIRKWNETVKKELLADIDNFEKELTCAKKSTNMAELGRCFPK